MRLYIVVLFALHSHRLCLEVFPQRLDELGDRDGVGVMCDQSQDKDSVFTEVRVNKPSCCHFILVIILQFVNEPQMSLHVLPAPVPDRKSNDPQYQRVQRQRSHEQHPEVQEEKDLLVKEVDWKNALYIIAMDGAKSANLQIAHCDSWKSGRRQDRRGRRRPISADFYYATNDVNAVRVKWKSEKRVEQEELADDVDEVQALDDQVCNDEIVTTVTTTQATDCAREEAFQTQRKANVTLANVMTAQVSDTQHRSD